MTRHSIERKGISAQEFQVWSREASEFKGYLCAGYIPDNRSTMHEGKGWVTFDNSASALLFKLGAKTG